MVVDMVGVVHSSENTLTNEDLQSVITLMGTGLTLGETISGVKELKPLINLQLAYTGYPDSLLNIDDATLIVNALRRDILPFQQENLSTQPTATTEPPQVPEAPHPLTIARSGSGPTPWQKLENPYLPKIVTVSSLEQALALPRTELQQSVLDQITDRTKNFSTQYIQGVHGQCGRGVFVETLEQTSLVGSILSDEQARESGITLPGKAPYNGKYASTSWQAFMTEHWTLYQLPDGTTVQQFTETVDSEAIPPGSVILYPRPDGSPPWSGEPNPGHIQVKQAPGRYSSDFIHGAYVYSNSNASGVIDGGAMIFVPRTSANNPLVQFDSQRAEADKVEFLGYSDSLPPTDMTAASSGFSLLAQQVNWLSEQLNLDIGPLDQNPLWTHELEAAVTELGHRFDVTVNSLADATNLINAAVHYVGQHNPDVLNTRFLVLNDTILGQVLGTVSNQNLGLVPPPRP